MDALDVLESLKGSVKAPGKTWEPVPNMFQYDGEMSGLPRLLEVWQTKDMTLLLITNHNDVRTAIELPPGLRLCELGEE